MIVKVHARGAGGGSGPTGYLLGRDGQRELAVTLRGDPVEVRDLIDSTKFARKYTSGVLSFAEADLRPEQKAKIMDSFESALLPGMDKNQYSILWVEHRDKGRLELNFVIPNVELTSGKRLQPYYHGADCRRVNAWAETVRFEHKLADPNDPARRRALTTPSDLPKDKQEAARAITDGLLAMAGTGSIKSRADVVKTLTGAGFTVARETKSSISIKDPSGGQNLRLKGALYERDFTVSKDLRGELERASQQHKADAITRVIAARKELERGIEIKREYLNKRYSREPEALESHSVKQLEMDNNHLGITGFDRSSDPRDYGLDDKRQSYENQRTEGDFSEARDPQYQVSGADHGREKGGLFDTSERPQTGDTVHSREAANSTDREELDHEQRSREGIISRIRDVAERAIEATQSLTERAKEATGAFYSHCKRLAGAAGEVERAEQIIGRAGGQLERSSADFAEKVEGLNPVEALQMLAKAHNESLEGYGTKAAPKGYSRTGGGHDRTPDNDRGGMSM